jgi:hypothetical protein
MKLLETGEYGTAILHLFNAFICLGTWSKNYWTDRKILVFSYIFTAAVNLFISILQIFNPVSYYVWVRLREAKTTGLIAKKFGFS